MRRHRLPVLGFVAVAALALTACQPSSADNTAEPAPITVATLPLGEDPTQVNPIDAFAELLENETGRPVEINDVPDYLSVVEAIRADHVDIGIMSGFPSALAVNTGEVDALVAWEGDEAPVSTCIVLDDSPIEELEDLRGATVAFADQGSSSGYFMPVYMLHEAGLERDVDYQTIFAGGHEGSFIALEQGQVDAACTAFMLTELGEPIFPFQDGEWRAVGESPSMPIAGAMLVRQSIDSETRSVLEAAVPAVYSEENAEALGVLGSGFIGREAIIAPEPALFDGFVEIAAVAGVELQDLG